MRGGLAVIGMSTAALALLALPATAAGPAVSGPTILSFSELLATGAQAAGVNAGGIAYGYVNNPFGASYQKAVIWKGTTPTDITPSGGTHEASCIGVSDDGTTSAGNEILSNGGVQAFVRQGSTTTLLAAGTEAWAVASDGTVLLIQQVGGAALWHNGTTTSIGAWTGVAISPKGVVVGAAQTASGPVYLYSGGVTVSLPLPAGRSNAGPDLVNDSGYVVGTAGTGTSSENVLWHGSIVNKAWQGTTTVLQPPTGIGTIQGISLTGVNATGTVIGNAVTAAGTFPVRWSSAGVPTVLSATGGVADGINDAGVIVGATGTGSTATTTVWDGSTTLTLPKGGYADVNAAAINNAGKIVGMAQTPGFINGGPHAVSWTVTG